MKLGLSLRMVREHRWSYAGLAVVLVIASTLVGVAFLVAQAVGGGLPSTAGLTRNEVAIRLGQLSSGGAVAQYLVFLSTFLAGVLVFQIVAFLIDGRRKEIALLRLNGARKRQIVAMLVGESLLLAVIASILGGVFALASATPFSRILTLSQNWPAGLPVELHPLALIPCILLVPGAAIIGTLAAAARAVRVPAIAAVGEIASPTKNRPLSRIVIGSLGAIGIIAVLFLPYDGSTLIVLPSLVGALAVVVASALAPFVIPIISAPIGYLLTLLAPGAGFIARKRIGFDRYRAAAVSTPIVILLGLGTVFGMFALTGRAYTGSAYQAVTNVQAVVELPGERRDPNLAKELAARPEVASMTSMQSTKLWSWDDPDVPEDAYLLLEAIEPKTFAHFVPANVIAGDLTRVTGTQVAVTTSTPYKVGESVAIKSPAGDREELRVVAVVESSPLVGANILVDADRFMITDPDSTQTWLVQGALGNDESSVAKAVNAVVSGADVMTRAEWISAQSQRQTESLNIAVLTVVGGGAVFAMVSLGLTVLASARERSRELKTLRSTGARFRSAVASVVLETGLACATAMLLGGAIVALVYARMRSALDQMQAGMAPVVPTGMILIIVIVSMGIGLVAAALGSSLALRSGKSGGMAA